MIGKFIYAGILLIVCIFVNEMLILLFGYHSPIFNFLAPMNEEAIRLFSIAQGSPISWLFTTFMVVHEFLNSGQVAKETLGYIPISLIVLRIICSIAHFILLGIQFLGWKLFKQNDNKKYIIITYFSAVLLHYIWNTQISRIIVQLMFF
jgi:hypothetical protein